MNKTQKTLTIIGSVLLLGGLAIFLYRKTRKPKDTKEVLSDVFDNLNFQFGKSEIKKESYPYLDNLADTLLKAKDWRIEIQGHTDNKGTEDFNLKLSQNRANSVKDYLISKGVPEENITSIGFGEAKPIADNDTEANREKNRRVEFRITKPNQEVVTTIAQ